MKHFFLLLSFVFNYTPKAIVVPHHNAYKEIRAEFISRISQERLITNHVIIIGPSHFTPKPNGIYYGDYYRFDQKLFTKLNFPISLNNNLIQSDHAFFNLIPDIKTYFPKAKITPILIGQAYPFEKLEPLILKIKKYCTRDCLIIASIDFTHYTNKYLANKWDKKTIEALTDFDFESIKKAKIDSPQTLYVLSKYSYLNNFKKFILFNNTYAAQTSHIYGVYLKYGNTKYNPSSN